MIEDSRVVRISLFLFLLCIISCTTPYQQATKDLDFVFETLVQNHPGVCNKADPYFNQQLETAYTVAKHSLLQAKTQHAKQRALTQFSEQFGDSHLWVQWACPKSDSGVRKKMEPFSLHFIQKGIVWVRLGTFDLNQTQEQAFKSLLQRLSAARQCAFIIIDLRGNQGGNSSYGTELIDTLFGKSYTTFKRNAYEKRVYVDWRASQGNVEHLSALCDKYPHQDWLKKVHKGLQHSLDTGKPFYREAYIPMLNAQLQQSIQPKTQATFIVLIDGFNVSAALDFIDDLKLMTRHIHLVGQQTKADRLYMEVRTVPLPSGMGTFSFPIKVYRNRLRPDNQSYFPDIEYKEMDQPAALQEFVLKKIQDGTIPFSGSKKP